MFFPMLSNRIWMLSGLCCCIVVFTFCLFTCMPQVWVYLPARRMPVNAFHVFHTMLDTSFHLLQHNCIMLYSYFFLTKPHLFLECPAESSDVRCGTLDDNDVMYYCVSADTPTGLHAVLINVKPFVSQALSQQTDC